MADEIAYAIHKHRTDDRWPGLRRFTVAFDNLTRAEATDALLMLDRWQKARDDQQRRAVDWHQPATYVLTKLVKDFGEATLLKDTELAVRRDRVLPRPHLVGDQ